ncbi:MAG TPA: wax ester/triacylglycerol synthase family O-acyltransferase [Nocardioides sp.]|nr:wax ester/triacylglycerol synthase family O-acyltransferase [Nocardioides sp.]
MTNIALNDAMFLLGEGPGRPAQVVALQLFRPPAGEDAREWVERLYPELIAAEDLKLPFRRRPARTMASPSTYRWVDGDPVDLDHHVRRSALPGKARVRELLEAVSIEHGAALDRRRPLWEYHLYEGLEDGRYATALKTHHAILDGVSLAKHVLGSLTPDPGARDCRPLWAGADEPASASCRNGNPLAPLTRSASAVRSLVEMARDTNARVPFAAPPSPLNVKVGGARRFAGDKWDLARLKAVASAVGGSVNDVGLAMCGAALRGYLAELDVLPDRSLIAMVPVSVRNKDPETAAVQGNAFGATLCDLGTAEPDGLARLSSIRDQMRGAKDRFGGMSAAEVLAVSKLIMGGAIFSSFTGITSLPRQPFNLVISNVPATDFPLYYNGAEMTDIYPVSMISEAQAMNITMSRYAGFMNFGVVGDRKALPSLQRILVHLDQALEDLEKATAS